LNQIEIVSLAQIKTFRASDAELAQWWGKQAPAAKATDPTADLSEHQEQCLVIDWCNAHLDLDPRLELIFAIPNGLWAKNKGVALKAKAEGLKKGVPDLLLPIASKGWHGLFIEMKKLTGSSTSTAQKQWHTDLREQGYAVELCKGRAQAIAAIVAYLELGAIEGKIKVIKPR
jgi:VRR-NUC domain